MNYKESGFRAFYRHFTAFTLTDALLGCVDGFPGSDRANCVLTYGYIDTEAGLTLEVMAAGVRDGDSFRFFDTDDTVRSFIRIGTVEDEEFTWFRDEDEALTDRYASKIAILSSYDVSEEIEKTRDMSFLDANRDEYCIDDVLVYLTGEGRKPEGCYVRITGLGEHSFTGQLLNEPDQDFGRHVGDSIVFFVEEEEDGSVICLSDDTERMRLTEADLEDGSLLREAIRVFKNDRSERNYIRVLRLLRNSSVWIPCSAVMSERDREMWNKAVAEAGGDPDSLIGRDFVSRDEIRMVPDILVSGDDHFFPVFTSEEAMGEYGDSFSRVQRDFPGVIAMARNNEKNVAGIVVDAFTENFVLVRDLFDTVENMEPGIG